MTKAQAKNRWANYAASIDCCVRSAKRPQQTSDVSGGQTSTHGNIRASRAHSLTYSADRMPTPWAADDRVGRAERPPHTTRQALNHPQRAAAHRASLPAKLALHSTVNAGAQHSTSSSTHQRARSTADARATPTHTHAQHARAARQRNATHRAHLPTSSAAAGLPQPTSHTRAPTLPTTGSRIVRGRESHRDRRVGLRP